MKNKHIIYIVADQLRYDVLGIGYTPNIDAIAAQGVSFNRAYCACPLCVPARGALFTGTFPNNNGSLINPWLLGDKPYGYVKSGIDNVYEMFERLGYDCIHSGKQHLYLQDGILEEKKTSKIKWMSTEHTYKTYLQEKGVRAPGGAEFRSPVPEMGAGKHTRVCTYSNANTGCYEHGENNYFDGYFTDKAVEGLQARDKTKPLFLSAMFLAPHPPLDIPQPYYSAVKAEDVNLPENVGCWYPYQSPLQMYNLTGVVGARYNNKQWLETWRVYLGLVTLLDNCVGRIVEELKAQGIYDDCTIIFTADHGEMLGSHKLFQKMCMYEESAKVPLYIKLPNNINAGKQVNEPVSHVDVQPTICDIMQTKFSSKMDGVSLLAAIETNEKPSHDVFIQFDGNGSLSNFQRCVVSGNHKLIVDIFKDEVYFELYDVCNDPQEISNLLFEEGNINLAQNLLNKLLLHMETTNDRISLPEIDLNEFIKNYADIPSRA